jgi:hypothetical protein
MDFTYRPISLARNIEENILRYNVLRQNILSTKRPWRQNVLDKTSSETKVLRTKCFQGQNVLRDKASSDKRSFSDIFKNIIYDFFIIFMNNLLFSAGKPVRNILLLYLHAETSMNICTINRVTSILTELDLNLQSPAYFCSKQKSNKSSSR